MIPAVVLAAGDGGRLGRHTAHLPKPLVPVAGRPLIAYTLDALAAAGVTEATIVTGYREAQVRAALLGEAAGAHGLRLSFASNPRFHEGANLSLAAARPTCGDSPFLLVMADHVLSAGLLKRLLAAASGPAGEIAVTHVAADFDPRDSLYAEEATRLTIDAAGHVTAIAKHLPAWDALDAGAFACTSEAWEALDALPASSELSPLFGALAARGRLFAADVSSCFWYDIDTPADLAAAEAIINDAHAFSAARALPHRASAALRTAPPAGRGE